MRERRVGAMAASRATRRGWLALERRHRVALVVVVALWLAVLVAGIARYDALPPSSRIGFPPRWISPTLLGEPGVVGARANLPVVGPLVGCRLAAGRRPLPPAPHGWPCCPRAAPRWRDLPAPRRRAAPRRPCCPSRCPWPSPARQATLTAPARAAAPVAARPARCWPRAARPAGL